MVRKERKEKKKEEVIDRLPLPGGFKVLIQGFRIRHVFLDIQ